MTEVWKYLNIKHGCSRFVERYFRTNLCTSASTLHTTTNNDNIMVYGILHGCYQATKQAKNFIYIDHAYISQHKGIDNVLKRGGYLRLVKNNFLHDINNIPEYPNDRFNIHKIKIKPWKSNGSHIIIVPPSIFYIKNIDEQLKNWECKISKEIQEYTDRPIYISTKQTKNFFKLLSDAWCVVTYQSNTFFDAWINGTPAIRLFPNANFGQIKDIENPPKPDRQHVLNYLTYKQFTLAEIANGTAKKILEDAQEI